MMEVLFPVLLVAGIGLVAGLGLAIASAVMAVPKDEKAEAIQEMLPGANCGACGFSGCSGYAAALAKGEAKPGLCSPGGAEVAAEISAFLGLGGVDVEKKVAVVRCSGSEDYAGEKMRYAGIESCAAAVQLAGGPLFLLLRLRGLRRLREGLPVWRRGDLQRRCAHRSRPLQGLLAVRFRLPEAAHRPRTLPQAGRGAVQQL